MQQLRSYPVAIAMFEFTDFNSIVFQLESPMQQCHQKVMPLGIVYYATTLPTIGKGKIEFVCRSALQEAALGGFSAIPPSALKLLAKEISSTQKSKETEYNTHYINYIYYCMT